VKEEFVEHVNGLIDQVEGILQNHALPPEAARALQETVEEFAATMEELHTTEEELRQQNEALVEARGTLEEERSRYAALFEAAPVGYLVTDTHGIIQEANRAAAHLVNVPQQYLEGKPLRLYLESPRSTAYDRLLRRSLSNRSPENFPFGDQEELRLSARGGKLRHILATVSSVRDAAGETVGLRWVLQDITERVRAEKEHELLLERLKAAYGRSEALAQELQEWSVLETIMENTPAHLAYLDPDFNFIHVNEAYAASSDHTKEELVGQNHFDLFPHEENRAIFRRVVETGEAARYHAKPFAYPGEPGRTTYWDWTLAPVFDAQEEVCALVFSLLDVTEQVEARQRIAELVARDEAILNSLREGLIIFDMQGDVLHMNPAALRMHGFEAWQERHSSLQDSTQLAELHDLEGNLLGPEEWPAGRVMGGESFVDYEVEVTHLDTGHEWAGSYNGTPVRYASGEVELGILTVRDITEEVEAERERELLMVRLARAREAAEEQARAARRRADERDTIFLAMTDAVVVYDEEGAPVLANPAAVRAYGFNPMETDRGEAKRALSIRHPGGEEVALEELPSTRALKGQRVTGERYTFTNAEGQPLIFHASAAPLWQEGRVTGAVAVWHDVTEREALLQELAHHAERLETLRQLDQSILAALSAEEIAARALPRLKELLPGCHVSVTLLDVEAMEGEVLAVVTEEGTVLRPGDLGKLETTEPLETLVRGEVVAVEDLEAIHRNSLEEGLYEEGVRAYTALPLRSSGALVGVLTVGSDEPGALDDEQRLIARDVADQLAIGIRQAQLHEQVQRHAEQLERSVARRTAALHASEARFRAIYEEAAIGIALLDREGRVLQANPALQELLAYEEEELRAMRFTDYTHPQDVDAARERYRAFMAGEAPHTDYQVQKRYVCRDGEVRWVSVVVSLVRPDADCPQFAISMIEDVTAQRQAQEALIQAEKMSVTGRLAASLAHEINNPLQTVVGCLGLAEETLAEEGRVNRYLEMASREIDRAARIVGELRDLNRQSIPEELEDIEVTELLERVLALADQQAQNRNVEVDWQPAREPLPPIRAVSDRLHQVYLNLILNALDAMQDGGRLLVRARSTEEPGVEVSFQDTGVGIPGEELPHLFEPFYTTKTDGVGLGLFISRNIVEDHGGRIEVESAYGEGTTFIVWLPAEG
jgi:PAS domain S-box-containing protein